MERPHQTSFTKPPIDKSGHEVVIIAPWSPTHDRGSIHLPDLAASQQLTTFFAFMAETDAPLLRRHSSKAELIISHPNHGPRSVSSELFCGAVGGTLGAIVVHPIDTVKTRLQAGQPAAIGGIFRRQGISGFYRGIGVPLFSQPLYIGAALGGLQAGRFISSLATGGKSEDVASFVFAGAVSGVCCATAVTPGERLKTLLQASDRPRSLLEASRSIARGGRSSVFRGWSTTVCREVPGCVIWFAAYEAAQNILMDRFGVSRELSVIGGATAAGVVYTSMATPLDRIKTMQQASEGSTAGAHTVAARILRSQGLRGFWVGVLPAMGRNILIDWIQFSAADRLRGSWFGHL